MSRIAVVTSSPPFAEGGHLVIARSLTRALEEAGHEASLMVTPQNRFGRQGAAYLATWLTDAGQDASGRRVDQVISLRYPSYAVRHPAHTCWLNHTMREYYDQWPRFSARLSPATRVKEIARRRLIRAADRYLLRHNVRSLFTISRTVSDRLRRCLSLASTPLHPPAPQRPYRCDGYDDYILAVSRLTPLKRLDLLLRALAERDAAGLRCVIVGDGEERDALQRLARQLQVDGRVTFVGAVDEATLLAHYAACRVVCFPPMDEDYGFVTVEAFASRKPVVTCTDSGGAAELVEHERTGLITAPEPAALARALRSLLDHRVLAEAMGGAAEDVAQALTWSRTVERLVIV